MTLQSGMDLREGGEKFVGGFRRGDPPSKEDHRPSRLEPNRVPKSLALWSRRRAVATKEAIVDNIGHKKKPVLGHAILQVELTIARADTEEPCNALEQPPVECSAEAPPRGGGRICVYGRVSPYQHRHSEQHCLAHCLT